MTETIRYCVGGRWAGPDADTTLTCCLRGRHAEDCQHARTEAQKLMNLQNWTPESFSPEQRAVMECRGCLPRFATEGHLCGTCHRYLEQWLGNGTPNSILWVHGHLTSELARRGSSAAREDWQRGSADGVASVIREGIFDCRRLIEDRVYIAEERLRQALHKPLADAGPFVLAESVAFLRNHILRIEDDPLLVAELYRKMQDSMVTAHSLAPWRATATKVRSTDGPIPCPHCERKSLVMFGGDSFITCRFCGTTIHRERFDQWTALIEEARGA